MARGPENTFIGSVHRHLPPVKNVYRMKNHNEYVAGVADCWYDGNDTDLWVEYKFLVVPKRDTTVIDLMNPKADQISPLQAEWLADRSRNGRNVWVIVGCKEGGVVFKDMTWVRPVTTGEFRNSILSRPKIAEQLASFVQRPP